MSLLKRFAVLYSNKYLFMTNTATGIVFFGASDLIIQKVIERRCSFDGKRLTNSCIAGGYMGLAGHFWYGFLDRIFPGRTRSIIIKKLFCEALVGPPFACTIFLLVGQLNKKSTEQIFSDIKDNFHYLCMADWGFYIPLQYFNFQYLPPQFRVLYVSFLSLIYDTMLVYILYRNDTQRQLQKVQNKPQN